MSYFTPYKIFKEIAAKNKIRRHQVVDMFFYCYAEHSDKIFFSFPNPSQVLFTADISTHVFIFKKNYFETYGKKNVEIVAGENVILYFIDDEIKEKAKTLQYKSKDGKNYCIDIDGWFKKPQKLVDNSDYEPLIHLAWYGLMRQGQLIKSKQ